MPSLADAIKAETAVLEAIASAPLPDSSFLNGRSQICNESDSMQMKITDDDITALRKEIKTTLDESSQSKWFLDMPHIIIGCVSEMFELLSPTQINVRCIGMQVQ